MTRQDLITQAEAQMAAYPQYAGHFSDYRLVRIRKDVRTKMGLAFAKGDFAIARPSDPNDRMMSGFPVVYSSRNRVDTAVPASAVQEVEAG